MVSNASIQTVPSVATGSANGTTGQFTSTFNSFGVISRVNNDLSVVAKADLPDSVWLNGALDDIRVYNSVLTAGEIRQMIPLVATTGVTAVGGPSAVQLNWSPTPGAETYNVKRSNVAGGPYTTVASGLTSVRVRSRSSARGDRGPPGRTMGGTTPADAHSP